MQKVKSFDIVILNNNSSDREVLEQKLKSTIQSIPLKDLYEFKFHIPETMENLLDLVTKNNWMGSRAIAYMDAQEPLNKQEKAFLLLKINKKIRPVIIVNNKEMLLRFKEDLKSPINADFILKNSYTLDVCSVLLEQFIEQKS